MESRIPHGVCPNCSAKILKHHFDGQHCNGEWFESKGFECGSEYRWSPNFSRLETVVACPKSATGIEQRKRSELIQKLTDYKLYEELKTWPTDLLEYMVKAYERSLKLKAKRKADAEAKNPPRKLSWQEELEAEAKYQEYLGRGM